MDRCLFCGHENLIKTQAEYTYKRDGKFLLVEDVPCLQCQFCGEAYYAAKDLKRIEQEFEAIHSQGKQAKRQLIVPVQGFLELGAS